MDGDGDHEFVLGFIEGGNACEFSGTRRIAKVEGSGMVRLSQPFGQCMGAPEIRKGKQGVEVYLKDVASSGGERVQWRQGRWQVDRLKKNTSKRMP